MAVSGMATTASAARAAPRPTPNTGAQKIARNFARDAAHLQQYAALGWEILVIWECETKNEAALALRLRDFMKAAP